jgi:hypothetical protein
VSWVVRVSKYGVVDDGASDVVIWRVRARALAIVNCWRRIIVKKERLEKHLAGEGTNDRFAKR